MRLETLTLKSIQELQAAIEAQGIEADLIGAERAFMATPYRWALLNEKGEAIAAGGFCEALPGVAEVWAVVSNEAREKHRLALSKAVKGCVAVGLKRFHRLQAAVVAEYVDGVRWAEFFGFEKEGRMKSYYGVGKDAWRMSLCRG